jgi:hypothetical protein
MSDHQQPPRGPADASQDETRVAASSASSASSADVAAPSLPSTPAGDQPAATRLPRVAALDLLGRLKATVVVGSVMAFGVFLALAAAHATGVTARGAATSGVPGARATTQPDDGGFFNGGFGVGAPGSRGPASGTTVS